jgi:diacylglycerol kinase family enzyme
MANIAVIANLNAASVISVKDLREKFSTYEAEVQVIPFSAHYKHDIKLAIKQGARRIIAVGGDGTVNAVANEAIKAKVALGVIPLGTLNHFAKDTQLPLNTDEAIACIIKGKTKKIDVGMVNNHVFVNNSSIGMYPQFVRERKKHQPLITKWLAACIAVIKTAFTLRNQHVTVRINGKTLHQVTPFIFIGNNVYDPYKNDVITRQQLDAGVLGVHIAKTRNLMAMLRTTAQLFIGQRPSRHDLESFTTNKLTISLKKPHVHVAIDGEAIKMTSPIHYSSEHYALTLIVP